MSFNVTAEAYTRFMGRYSEPLAAQVAELTGAHRGDRALDVGCGAGALTAELVDRLGTDAGAYVAGLDARQRDKLQTRCEQLLPAAPFDIDASAWCALDST